MKEVVEAAWDFWWGLGEGVRERLAPWSEAGPLLARLAPGKVLELAKRLRGEDADARRAAAVALLAMGPAAARPEVLQALTELLLDEYEDADVRKAAAEALGRMGEAAARPEVLQTLRVYLDDEDWYVRKAAAEVLTAWHRQGLRFFLDAQGHWTIRTVEELSGGAQLPDGGPRRRQGRARRRRLPQV